MVGGVRVGVIVGGVVGVRCVEVASVDVVGVVSGVATGGSCGVGWSWLCGRCVWG